MTEFVRLDPSKRITNAELAEAINKTHDCVHKGFSDTQTDIRNLTTAVTGDRDEWRASIRKIEAALSIPHPPEKGKRRPRRTFGQLKQWEAYLRLGSAIAGVLVLYKVAEPVIIAGAVALRHALLNF